jgi:PhzF family phenazine biosynthesis protein
MKKIPLYQVDVFAEALFKGNPAAVCPLDAWLPDATLQGIALNNNLAETAYLVKSTKRDADFDLRWFTPTLEIELCGHATLASGFVLFNDLGYRSERIRFSTRSGILVVERRADALWLDLPASMPAPLAAVPADAIAGLGREPQSWWMSRVNFVAQFEREADVVALAPDFTRLRKLTGRGVIATAPADRDADFVSRYFAPGLGVDEDPATGSAHAALTPFWAKQLGRSKLRALQRSPRGAVFDCELVGDRAWMSGPVVPYLRGEITLP